jgi:riboflavin kinase/FMN adenylyltransferase
MQIIKKINHLDEISRGAAVALGNFDGVHRGHQAVIGEACRLARSNGVPSAVMTFEPHPRRFFRPGDRLFELTPAQTKARHLETFGVDILYLLQFDADLAGMPAEKFVTDILIGGAGVSHVVAGYDFVFGQGRQGNLALLQEMGASNNFGVTIVPAIQGDGGVPYSSTVIRSHLREGRPREAAALLGRCWEVEGVVQSGDQRGRQIGFPTANVDPGDYIMPALGVYAVWAGVVDGGGTVWHRAIVNVGRRPTFEGEGVTVEAHIFDFDQDIYGKIVRVAFVDFLRPEMKFDGIDSIRAQIEKDCVQARGVLEASSTDDLGLPPSPDGLKTP